MIVDLRVGDALIRARLLQTRRFREGEVVHLSLDPQRLHLFEEQGPRIEFAAGEQALPPRVAAVPF